MNRWVWIVLVTTFGCTNDFDQFRRPNVVQDAGDAGERDCTMGDCNVKELTIDGVRYVRANSVQAAPTGPRCVVVVDRGWIFAGDVSEIDGRIKLTRAVWVFNWTSIGFDGVLKDPKSKNVDIRKLDHHVDLPADAEVFRIPVDNNWGL